MTLTRGRHVPANKRVCLRAGRRWHQSHYLFYFGAVNLQGEMVSSTRNRKPRSVIVQPSSTERLWEKGFKIRVENAVRSVNKNKDQSRTIQKSLVMMMMHQTDEKDEE